jgi:hypothetical protein
MSLPVLITGIICLIGGIAFVNGGLQWLGFTMAFIAGWFFYAALDGEK